MKKFMSSCGLLTLVVLAGCTQGTPGGPGTKGTQPSLGQANDTFNLSVPIMSSTLQQGRQSEATVGIQRATNFSEDVSLKFTDIPKGVTIEPANPVIKHGDKEAHITFKADDDAQLGDFKVKVTGHPSRGSDAVVDLKLTVTAKDTFTLSAPRLSTSLTQGQSQSVSIGINREETFDQDVVLTFAKLPEGVTMTPEAPMIKRGEAETNVTLTGADDASLGNFAIKITGHPTVGKDALSELTLTVVSK